MRRDLERTRFRIRSLTPAAFATCDADAASVYAQHPTTCVHDFISSYPVHPTILHRRHRHGTATPDDGFELLATSMTAAVTFDCSTAQRSECGPLTFRCVRRRPRLKAFSIAVLSPRHPATAVWEHANGDRRPRRRQNPTSSRPRHCHRQRRQQPPFASTARHRPWAYQPVTGTSQASPPIQNDALLLCAVSAPSPMRDGDVGRQHLHFSRPRFPGRAGVSLSFARAVIRRPVTSSSPGTILNRPPAATHTAIAAPYRRWSRG